MSAFAFSHASILNLCSSALILNWVVARATSSISRSASLSEAEEWVLGAPCRSMLSHALAPSSQSDILIPLRDLHCNSDFLDMLPYATEVFETSDEILIALGAARAVKRKTGVFYTPSDVSDFIVEHAYSSVTDSGTRSPTRWLDPACGTGVFLLSALYKLAESRQVTTGENALQCVADSLFGIDISPLALQSALYILTLSCIFHGWLSESPLIKWLHTIGDNLLVFDSTCIRDTKQLSQYVPRLACGADFVVSNPPYAKGLVNRSQFSLGFDGYGSSSRPGNDNLHPRFVRMLNTLSHPEHGAGGMVVPLSIAFSSHGDFKSLRSLMQRQGTVWKLAHFDRTPDSLFGDDVKTRTTIVFYQADRHAQNQLYSTYLMRWNSRSRLQLFKNIAFCRIGPDLLRGSIPKVGDEFGYSLLENIYACNLGSLSSMLSSVSSPEPAQDCLLRNATTAYNWLPFELLDTTPAERGHESNSRYRYWRAGSPESVLLVFAVLQSRLAYWMWRIWGDGFHLTDEFIKSLPLCPYRFSANTKLTLVRLAEELWDDMLNHRVTSLNSGVANISFCPHYSGPILDEVDSILVAEMRLSPQVGGYLKDFVRRIVVAGREMEADTSYDQYEQGIAK